MLNVLLNTVTAQVVPLIKRRSSGVDIVSVLESLDVFTTLSVSRSMIREIHLDKAAPPIKCAAVALRVAVEELGKTVDAIYADIATRRDRIRGRIQGGTFVYDQPSSVVDKVRRLVERVHQRRTVLCQMIMAFTASKDGESDEDDDYQTVFLEQNV